MEDSSSRLLEQSPNAIARRLMQKAHNRDGLPEIAIGLTFLTVACLNYVEMVSHPRSIAFVAAVLGLAIVVPILCIGSPWAIRWLRRHYLVERVGYVEFKPVNWRRFWVVFGIGFFLAAFVAAFAVSAKSFPPDSWVLAGTGIFGGALMAFAGRLPRFVIGGVVMAAAGILIGLGRVAMLTGFVMLFGLMGLLSLLSGCVVLLAFMRQPVEAGE